MMKTKRADGNSFTGARGQWVGLALAGLLILGGLGLDSQAAIDTHFVATNGLHQTPFTNGWASAATNIQAAIDAATDGDTVLVSNGVYNSGWTTNVENPAGLGSALPTRVNISKAITVRSASGNPATTIIKGAWDPVTTNGLGAVRGVFMAANSCLIGFTVTNGATYTNHMGNYGYCDGDGGGVRGASGSSVSNCVITGNAADRNGGGGAGSITFYDCRFINNVQVDAAAEGGGAMYAGTSYRCIFIGNRAAVCGAACGGTHYNGLFIGNYAQYYGAEDSSAMHNCTVTRNAAAGRSGGVSRGSLDNCIVQANYVGASVGNFAYMGGTAYVTNSCISPTSDLTTVSGSITNDPKFVDNGTGYGLTLVPGDYHLAKGSPCIDKGLIFSWVTNGASASRDLAGNPRLRGLYPDMGAYESAPPPGGSLLMLH